MKALFILISMLPFSAYTQVPTTAQEVVETPFWQAPAVKKLHLPLRSQNTLELENACKNFKIEMNQLKDEGFSRFNQKYIERLRKKPLYFDSEHTTFEESFAIDSGEEFAVELKENVISSNKLLPYYKNKRSTQRLISSGTEHFNLDAAADSMTKIVELFNLDIETPTIESTQNEGLVLKITTLDLACDLLDSKVQLTSELSSEVRLTKDRIKDIESFYQFNLLQKFSEIMKKKVSVNQKALLLGYRLSESYQNEIGENDREILETGFLELMNLIVDPETLKPSQYLYIADGRYFLDSNLYSAPAQVIVTLGKESL